MDAAGAAPVIARACVALLALAAGASGCANGRVSEQDEVRGVVRTFLDQCAEQRVLRVLPELVPAAQRIVAEAGSPTRGCARILGWPSAAAAAPADFADAAIALVAFDGARARVAVSGNGQNTTVELARGRERWRIEAR